MAAKIRGLGRLLLALTLLGWGQFVFAVDYYWFSGGGLQGPDPAILCKRVAESRSTYVPGSHMLEYPHPSYPSNPGYANCKWTRTYINGSTGTDTETLSRRGDGCTLPKVWDSATGQCKEPTAPADCSATAGKQITAAQTCTYDPGVKTYVCEDQIQQDGCLYTGGPNRKCVADLITGTAICTGDFYGSGQAAGEGTDGCTDTSCTPPRDPTVPPAEEQCVTNGDLTICHSPQDEGCGTVNGEEGCFQEEPGCGYFNGTYQCVDADKPKNNCGYYNGKLTCMDPNDPTQVIPETSPDHPKNGGNADGNENNDPKAPGDTSTNPQGSDQGATNEAIGELGEELGGKIDGTNDLLGDIKGILGDIAEGIEGLTDGLLGDDYDGSGDGDGQALEGIGSGLGNDLAGMFGDQLGEAQEQQLADDELSLDDVADRVDGDKWFGDNSQVAELLQFADGLLPSYTSCNDVTLTFSLGSYQTRVVLPVCEIAPLVSLLEWIIYVVTAIGLWNITYATLRMENAKASKGGF